jgi:glutamine amidotransferase
VQGNIKKKRASLSAIDAAHGGGGMAQYFDNSPITPEPVRTEFGNPNKIAQLFPELALQ